MSALKSQIESMSGTAAAAPAVRAQSQLERYIVSDLKGGDHKRAFMLSLVASNILEAYKGNSRDIVESLKLCDGKAVKARAYLAGFTTIKDIAKIPYAGKWDASTNKAHRADVAIKVDASLALFTNAYDAVFVTDKADRAKAKADKPAKAAPVVADSGAPVSTGESVEARQHDTAVQMDGAVLAMIAMLNNGMLTGAQLDELGSAMRAAEGRALLADMVQMDEACAPVAPKRQRGKAKTAAAA